MPISQQARIPFAIGIVSMMLCFMGCASEKRTSKSSEPTSREASSPSSKETQPKAAHSATLPELEPDSFTPEPEFQPLMLDDFEIFHGKPPGESETWISSGGVIRCLGTPRGYIHSRKTYRNFVLRFDYRFAPPEDPETAEKANTGTLVYINGPHRLWPLCLEVQGKHQEMGHIKANGRADLIDAEQVRDDPGARETTRKPVGEWNSIEIVSQDGVLMSYLNGTKICENAPGELKEGALGFQSEDFVVDFRRLRIREAP